jgi:hypothetical protein
LFRFTIFREEIILIIEEGERSDFTLIQEVGRGKPPRDLVGLGVKP